MKKTTLTISWASVYADALLQDARISGRTLLAIQAEPDPRRSSGPADVPTGIQTASLAGRVAAKKAVSQDAPHEKSDNAGSGATDQADPEPVQEAESELEDQELAVAEAVAHARAENPVISWNPASFASTKAALIEAETTLGGTVNEAIVFIDPAGGGERLSDLTLGQIEAATTTWITGYAQLLRELGRRFAERGSGLILVVLLPGERGPLGAMAAGAMEALACSLAAQTGEPYRLFALRDESGQPELLARYIMKILDEPPRDSSKLLRHGGRITLFGK